MLLSCLLAIRYLDYKLVSSSHTIFFLHTANGLTMICYQTDITTNLLPLSVHITNKKGQRTV